MTENDKLFVTHGETEYRNGELCESSWRVSTGQTGDDTAILSGLTTEDQANRARRFLEMLPIDWTDWDEAIKQLLAMGYGNELALMRAACGQFSET